MSDYKEPFGKVLNSNSLLLSLNVCIPDYGEPKRKKETHLPYFSEKKKICENISCRIQQIG